jgi:hypothetical protein
MIIPNSKLEDYMLFNENMLKVIDHVFKGLSDSIMYQTEYSYRCGVHDFYNKLKGLL